MTQREAEPRKYRETEERLDQVKGMVENCLNMLIYSDIKTRSFDASVRYLRALEGLIFDAQREVQQQGELPCD